MHAGAAILRALPRLPRERRQRRPRRCRPLVVKALVAVAAIGLAVTIALGVEAESSGSLSSPGGWPTAAGRMTGLLAAYGMIVVVVLVTRFPPLERGLGQDRLVAWHRRLGPWPLCLLVAHVVLITIGYAQLSGDGPPHEFISLIWTYPGVLPAAIAFFLLIGAGVSSYRRVRRRLAYETWWSIHLYIYLALFLAFSHEVNNGASFVDHPAATAWWTALWLGVLALVLGCRIGLPAWRTVRHRLKVAEVTAVAPGTWSVLLEGRRLDRLPVAGGQFLKWRFLRPEWWWHSHPYSLSAVPSESRMRITIKDSGDHSGATPTLAPGTRVAIEGPYGTFTAERAAGNPVLLIGAGAGVTPLRALLEDLPRETDLVFVHRASSREDLILGEEIDRLVAERSGTLHELTGSRSTVRLDAATLLALVPDIWERDVYVCGPEAFTALVVSSVRIAGVPSSRTHLESFDF